MKYKKETLEEFLARGGKIKKIPTVEPVFSKNEVRLTPAKVATILSLSEASLFWGESKKNKRGKNET